MVHLRRCLYAVCIALMASAAVGLATSPVAAAAKEKSSMTPEEKKARSKECSAEADKQGLHGKERHKFRAKCKRETSETKS